MVRKNNPDPNTQQYACGTATRTARNTQDFAMTTWQEELRGSIRDAAGLRRAVGAGQPAREIEAVLAEYKMAIPPYYLGLIDWDDPNDPIRLQAVAAPNELVTIPEERHDPIGDQRWSPVHRLTHRYPDRVLI